MAGRSVLGKGLNALLPLADNEELQDANRRKEKQPYFLCRINAIVANPYQPRQDFDEEDLQQLSASIKEKGVLQPLIVRRLADNRFELIAGERRWRAAKMAGLKEVPALEREVEGVDRLELAIIENIQRQNLNPLDEALAYNRLMKEFGLTQEDVADRVGKNRSTVANFLRILQLPSYIRQDIAAGKLSAGHARALLTVDDPEALKGLRDAILSRGLSVRETEAKAASIKHAVAAPPAEAGSAAPLPPAKKTEGAISDSYCRALVNDLVNHLGSKAKIVQNGGRGRIEIEYYSLDDLERLIGVLMKK